MASKFQNRLVGTIIIVALGVIVLPGLLDGKKKHYKEEFAAIPLVPKPGDQQESDIVPPVTQPLPTQPPEGASEAIGRAERDSNSQADSGSTAPTSANSPTLVSPPPVQKSSVQQQPVQQQKAVEKSRQSERSKAVEKAAEKPRPVEKPPVRQPAQTQPKVETTQPKVETSPPRVETPAEKPAVSEAAPSGQAYVVQLGALMNAAKANEIVAQLRLSGYRAFTVPATPIAGQITRIYVGPDASKAKMHASVDALQRISGLKGGMVKPWSGR